MSSTAFLNRRRAFFRGSRRGAHIYVCGDADRMAGDVNQALYSVLQSEGGLSDERAATYLSELKSAHRYQRDVY